MKVTLEGNAKEIADLVLELQDRREDGHVPVINIGDLMGHSVRAEAFDLQSEHPANQLNKEAIQSLISEEKQKRMRLD